MTQKNCHIFISVVVPVFKSADLLPNTYAALRMALEKFSSEWEIIFVDDASPDATWKVLSKIRNEDSRVRIVRFAYNHGQQFATLCGLKRAKGNFVITMDDDLQFDPEDIRLFVEKIQAGYHVVIGKISNGEKKHAWWRNLGSRLNSYMIGRALKKPKGLSLSSFRGFSRVAVDIVSSYCGVHPHIAAIFLRSIPLEYISNVEVRHRSRADGSASTYTFFKLVKTASYIFINQTYAPLRFVVGWGALVSFGSIFFAMYIFIKALLFSSSVAGWASLATLISFLSGNILLALGVIGEYVGRMVEESSKSRQFVIFDEVG